MFLLVYLFTERNLCSPLLLLHFCRRRKRVVSEDRSVTPEWPLLMAERHTVSRLESGYPDAVGLPTARGVHATGP